MGRGIRVRGAEGGGEKFIYHVRIQQYIYKLDNGSLPERNNHHSWPGERVWKAKGRLDLDICPGATSS